MESVQGKQDNAERLDFKRNLPIIVIVLID